MSLLTICQNAADQIGLFRPSDIIGSSNQIAQQLLRMAKLEIEDLASQRMWNALIKEGTITLVAGDQDYAVPADFWGLAPGTTWDRTEEWEAIVVDPQHWALLKGRDYFTTTNRHFRIFDDQFQFFETITAADAGNEIKYEYISTYKVRDVVDTPKATFTANTDTTIFSEELVTQGIVWRYKHAKGLDYQMDMAVYERMKHREASKDGSTSILDLRGRKSETLGPHVKDHAYGI